MGATNRYTVCAEREKGIGAAGAILRKQDKAIASSREAG